MNWRLRLQTSGIYRDSAIPGSNLKSQNRRAGDSPPPALVWPRKSALRLHPCRALSSAPVKLSLNPPEPNLPTPNSEEAKKAATPQQMQEILTVLRTVYGVQKVFNYAQNAVAVRSDTDTMALVEKEFSSL